MPVTPLLSVMSRSFFVLGSTNAKRPCGVAEEQPASQLSSRGSGESASSRSAESICCWSTNEAPTTTDILSVVLPQETSYFWVKPSP